MATPGPAVEVAEGVGNFISVISEILSPVVTPRIARTQRGTQFIDARQLFQQPDVTLNWIMQEGGYDRRYYPY